MIGLVRTRQGHASLPFISSSLGLLVFLWIVMGCVMGLRNHFPRSNGLMNLPRRWQYDILYPTRETYLEATTAAWWGGCIFVLRQTSCHISVGREVPTTWVSSPVFSYRAWRALSESLRGASFIARRRELVGRWPSFGWGNLCVKQRLLMDGNGYKRTRTNG